MFTILDYYNNDISEDLDCYIDYDEYNYQIERCYEKYELQKAVDAITEERSWKKSFRCIHIKRIAEEAKQKYVSITLIYKFFKEYNVEQDEQLWFWQYYWDSNTLY